MSILMLLTMAVELDPDRVAVTSGDEQLTYGALLERSLATGELLRRDGADHMALPDLNTTAFPVALFGAAAAGVPLAPLNYRPSQARPTAEASRPPPAALFRGPGT